MKDFPITLGIDDAAFDLTSGRMKTPLIGVVCQGTRMVNVLRQEISVDGKDSTAKIIKLIKATEKHVQYVITDTITFGGFNICDLEKIYSKTKKPIIAVTERQINLDSVKTALLKRFPEIYLKKVQKIVHAGDLYEAAIPTAGGISTLYYHVKGINNETVEKLFEKVCVDSKSPECVRMAHIIGTIF